jgi:murein DD-endopeptidase MepM/ murein hydrolase activator NlpD
MDLFQSLTRLAAGARYPVLGLALLAGGAAADVPAFRLIDPPVQGALVRGVAPAGTAKLTLDGKPVALAADGRFILGFDRDQGAEAVLEARLADGRILRRPIAVVPRRWEIERIDLPQRPSMATEEYLRRRAAELARIAAARALAPESNGWRQHFVWPARGRISGRFGSQRVYRGQPGAYHSGVDVAAGAGATVVAPADGMVVLAGPPAFSLEGNLVIIAHGMGLNSAFLHLASVDVREGQMVRQGEKIGMVGATGRATGPHLHWGMKWNEARIDPASVAGPMPD